MWGSSQSGDDLLTAPSRGPAVERSWEPASRREGESQPLVFIPASGRQGLGLGLPARMVSAALTSASPPASVTGSAAPHSWLFFIWVGGHVWGGEFSSHPLVPSAFTLLIQFHSSIKQASWAWLDLIVCEQFLCDPHPPVLKAYSRVCAQGSLLLGLLDHCVLRIDTGLCACKASACCTVQTPY